MRAFTGRMVSLSNECALRCQYCGYPPAPTREIDLDQLTIEAQALAASGVRRFVIASKDPVEHPQFEEVLTRLLPLAKLQVETTGIRLHAVRGTASWARDPRIIWTVPYVSADAEVHDRIVGRPGHHAIVTELLFDESLELAAQVLLISDVVAGDNLARLARELRRAKRQALWRHFTPRTIGAPSYYDSNVPRLTALWPALDRALEPNAVSDFTTQNTRCFPPCVVPTSLQVAYADHFCQSVQPESEVLNDFSLRDMVECPRASACPFGSFCLGVYARYLERHGADEFQPANVAHTVLSTFEGTSAERCQAARELLILRNRGRALVEAGRYSDALAAVASASPRLSVEPALVDHRAELLATMVDRIGHAIGSDDPAATRRAIETLRPHLDSAQVLSLEARLRSSLARAASTSRDWRTVMRLCREGDTPGAEAEEWRALRNHAEIQLLFERYVDQRRSGHLGDAVVTLRRILRRDPDEPHALKDLGELLGRGASPLARPRPR